MEHFPILNNHKTQNKTQKKGAQQTPCKPIQPKCKPSNLSTHQKVNQK